MFSTASHYYVSTRILLGFPSSYVVVLSCCMNRGFSSICWNFLPVFKLSSHKILKMLDLYRPSPFMNFDHDTEQQGGCNMWSINSLPFRNTWVHKRDLLEFTLAIFNFPCWLFLVFVSSVLWCPLRVLHKKNDVRIIFTSSCW